MEAINITLKKGVPTGELPVHLPELAEEVFFFKGDEGNPFLAPRGVHIVANKLLVSDTGQNRVFIWNDLQQVLASGGLLAPDVVLGQLEKEHTGRNAGSGATAASLHYPSGLWSDGTRLLVADAWNHRVLVWHSFPTQHGQPADQVIGQPDFESNLPNVKGIGSAPSSQSLNWCYGLFSDGQQLWIADTGNRRILYYHRIPDHDFAAADEVIGKPSFDERDYEHEDPIWPYSVKVSPQGHLAVADTQYYRVLLWKNWQQAFKQKADFIIGQPSFEANGMNQYGLYPQANTLSWCYDACFDQQDLWVADTGNSRVLKFEGFPAQNNPTANNLLGKPNFTTGSENAETLFGTEKTLYWPFSVSIERPYLALADTGNHRIAIYRLK